MLRYLEGYTATDWALSFMNALDWTDVVDRHLTPATNVTGLDPENLPAEITERLDGRPLLLLTDYDGTLVPIRDLPDQAVLGRSMRSLLRRLTSIENVRMVAVSGRTSGFLRKQFRDLNISLAAEHGARYFRVRRQRWQSLVHTDRSQWMKTAVDIMTAYAARVPDSFVERKAYGVSWHYRRSPGEFAWHQSLKLREELELLLANLPAHVLQGKKVVEVRASEANKGHFVRWLLSTYPREDEVVIALGDDETDEDMFLALPRSAVTVRVGPGATAARYRIENQHQLPRFLRTLTGRIGEAG
jgi:trehalose 6-phosphate synthase/phosphatase